MSPPDDYVCTLTEASLKKAKEELNEDPKERLGAVEALRKWVLEQPHIKSPTDTWFLLRFLRARKFCQLEARTLLDNYWTVRTKYPKWFRNQDPEDPLFKEFYKKGHAMPLPKRDPDGRLVTLIRVGMVDPKKVDKDEMFKMMYTDMECMNLMDENVQVNGIVGIMDMTGYTLKHQTMFSLEERKISSEIWQKRMPVRFKQMHMYNEGAFIDFLFMIMKLTMSEKMQKRMKTHGSVLESLYKDVPMELLPDEYLPDDYTGPSAGPIKEVAEQMYRKITSSVACERIRYLSSGQFGVDESKRPKEPAPMESFRKLNVD